MIRKRLLAALGMLVLLGTGQAGDLAPALTQGTLWTMEKNDLAAGPLQGARYAPVDDNTIRLPRATGGVTIGKVSIGDLLMTWNEEKHVSLLQTTIYNKGDDGAVGRAEFDASLEKAKEALSELAGGQKPKPRKVSKRDSGVQVSAWEWEGENYAILLESATSSGGGSKTAGRKSGKGSRSSGKGEFVAEFIRLTIGPDLESLEKGGASDAVGRSALRGQKKVEEDGTVWIEGVPMVDQGQKGYCVPATVSRVFAYYGMDGVDQHALAALCKSSGDGGTSMSEMEEALRSISSAFHMRVNVLDKGGLTAIVEEYNKAAKKKRQPELSGAGGLNFDPDILLAARAGKDAQVRKWLAPIKKNIDAGIPVLWSVQLGLYPEPGLPQSSGGHMRLIIGYNAEKSTIVFSDTWGAAHARKEMPAKQACAMTMHRYVLRPTK